MPAKRVSPCVNMDSEQKVERMFELEMRYKQAVHQADLLVREEDGRRMKLHSMVLRDDNATLKDQIVYKDNCIKILVQQADDARHLIESIQQQCARQEKQIQAQIREITHLKEEIASFTSVSQDSAKILSEKFALTHEVAVLKPEIEHLKSQLSHQKDVLSEKLALERQLNTLEVELANEKRTLEKATQKQERYTKEEEELRRQVRELEKELNKERKAAQKGGDSQQVKTLREQLATAEKKFAVEKSKMEQAARAQEEKSTEMEEELEQIKGKLAETEKVLAAEKRAAQRKAKNQETKASVSEVELAALQEQIDELKQALAEEKKDKEQLQKKNQQAITEAEVRQAATDEKLDKFRTKLHETKEELKKCKADLEKAREKAAAALVTTTTIPTKEAAAKVASKKRRADEVLLEETAMGTPGAADRPKRPLKKRGFDPSDMVQKSTFSITPFLNKTLNPDGTTNEDAPAAAEGAAEGAAPEAAPKPTPAPAEDSLMELGDDSVLAHLRPTGNTPTDANVIEQIKKAGGAETEAGENSDKAEEKAKKGRGKVKAFKPLAASVASKKGPIKVPKLKISKVPPKPTEEQDGASAPAEPEPAETSKPAPKKKPELKPKTKPSSSAPTSETEQQQPTASQQAAPLQKKKKRKLLGNTSKTTLFDNDDEGERVDTSILPGGKGKTAAAVTGKATAKRVVMGAPGGVGVGKTMVGKVHIAGGSKNPFGKVDKFSPLKKDRRGVNASFLH